MREAVLFYRRWFSVAFHGALDRTALVAFLVLSAIDGSKHFYPGAGKVTETLVWAIPYWALAAVMVWRMIAAPFLIWREDRSKNAAAVAALKVKASEQSDQLARLNAPPPRDPDGIYQLRRRVGTVSGAEEIISEREIRFRRLTAEADFAPSTSFEYRDFQLVLSKFDASSRVRMPGHDRTEYHNALCLVRARI